MTRRPMNAKVVLLLLVVIGVLSVFSGVAAAAGTISVEAPADQLIADVAVTLPVYITNAEDIAGLVMYITEDSHATMSIKPSSSDIDGISLNVEKGKAVLNLFDPDGGGASSSLNGKVKLFDIEVTPATGENVNIQFDIEEVLDSANNDVTGSYTPVPGIIPVVNGKTVSVASATPAKSDDVEWVYDAAQGLTPADPVSVPTISSAATTSSSSSSSETLPATAGTTKPTATKTKKSPGFLPLTLVGALALSGFLIARRKGGQ